MIAQASAPVLVNRPIQSMLLAAPAALNETEQTHDGRTRLTDAAVAARVATASMTTPVSPMAASLPPRADRRPRLDFVEVERPAGASTTNIELLKDCLLRSISIAMNIACPTPGNPNKKCIESI